MFLFQARRWLLNILLSFHFHLSWSIKADSSPDFWDCLSLFNMKYDAPRTRPVMATAETATVDTDVSEP